MSDLTRSFESLGNMQQAFRPSSWLGEPAQRAARTYWQAQTETLDRMQKFVDGWIDRRYAGTRAALDACEHMCMAETPAELLREYQKWATGAFQRCLADAMACQEQMRTYTASPSLVPWKTEREPEPSEAKPRERARAA